MTQIKVKDCSEMFFEVFGTQKYMGFTQKLLIMTFPPDVDYTLSIISLFCQYICT